MLYQDIFQDEEKSTYDHEADIMIKRMQRFAEGMGLTPEEYREYMKPAIKKGLSLNRLKNKILQQLPDKERLDYSRSTRAIKEYIQTLYGKYKVEVKE